MLLKKAKQFLFIRLKQAIGSLWKRMRQGRKTSIQRAGLYLTCDEFPFDRFIQCSVHGKYELLIISGQHSQGDLLEAWSNIQLEYIDRIEEEETLYIVNLEKDITLLHHQITTTETTCYLLSMIYDEKLVQCLHELGYNYDFEEGNDKMNANSLGAIKNRLAPLKLKYQVKCIEYEELQKNKSVGEKASEKFYKMMLVRLAKFMGVPLIRAKDITTGEYCDLFKEFVSDINHQKKIMEEHGHKRNHK